MSWSQMVVHELFFNASGLWNSSSARSPCTKFTLMGAISRMLLSWAQHKSLMNRPDEMSVSQCFDTARHLAKLRGGNNTKICSTTPSGKIPYLHAAILLHVWKHHHVSWYKTTCDIQEKIVNKFKLRPYVAVFLNICGAHMNILRKTYTRTSPFSWTDHLYPSSWLSWPVSLPRLPNFKHVVQSLKKERKPTWWLFLCPFLDLHFTTNTQIGVQLKISNRINLDYLISS